MLQVCLDCGTAYASGLTACPQCGSTRWRPSYEEGADVPNITSQGVFFEPGHEPEGYVRPDLEGGEQPSPGGSSSTSAKSRNKSSSGTANENQWPAPSAENPSETPPPQRRAAKRSSTASTTDGNTRGTGSGRKGSDK